MLIIVNPYATTVSDRLKNLVVYALRGSLRGRRDRHRGPRSRHRAVPRGRPRGLRRGRRVRRRRHRQRGRQRPGRLGHAAELPARRARQRLLPDARDPRPTSSTRPSICCGSPTTGSPRRVDLGDVNEPQVPVLGRRRARRERGRARRRPPAAEGPARRVVLHVDGRPDVHPPLPAAPAAARGGARRRARRGRHARSSRTPRRTRTSATGPVEMAEGATLDERRPGRRRARARAAPSTSRRSSGARSRAARGSAATGTCIRSAASGELRVRSLDERPLPLQVDGDYIGEVDEAVFGVTPRRDHGRLLTRPCRRHVASRSLAACRWRAWSPCRLTRRGATAGAAHPLPGAPACPVFPADNPWNQRVDRAAGGGELRGDDREHRAQRPGSSGLRLGPLQRRADRDPVHGRVEAHPPRPGQLPVRVRVRRPPVSAARAASRSRAGAARAATAT